MVFYMQWSETIIINKNLFKFIGVSKKQMLVEKILRKEKTEVCNRCKAPLKNTDFVYRLRAPNVKTYVCSNCGYFEILFEE